MTNDKITDSEINTVAEILKKLEPGILPLPIFLEIARLYVSCIIEIVPIYNDNGNLKVLLQEREKEDPVWGGKLHTAGTVLRANDEEGNFQSAFNRLLSKELGGISIKRQPVFVKSLFHQVSRGRELALIFYVELTTNDVSHLGKLYEINNLPDKIVDTQVQFIQDVATHFI